MDVGEESFPRRNYDLSLRAMNVVARDLNVRVIILLKALKSERNVP